jgi:glycosyltransferase involved in cell wall biosynthesis
MTRTLHVALLTLGDPGRLTGGYLYHRRMAEAAPRHGARVAFLSIPERPFPLGLLDGPAALERVRRLRPDALLLDSIAAAFVGPWLALGPRLPPILGTLHQPPGGIDHAPPRAAMQAALDTLAYRRARLLMVASDWLADQFAGQGWPRDRLRVVPPGRDVATADGPPPGDLRRGRRAAFLAVGNWMERKDFHSLLEAVARLPDEAATLHLAGDERVEPTYAARLRARMARPDLAGRVVAHGPLSREQVAGLYRAADAFALPSRKEPYGTVWGEAMAFGLPVVGWQAENLPYLADQGVEALMAPLGDLDALATALQQLADDEPLRRRLGRAAQARALGRPTWEQSAARFFGTIREVVDG